MSVKLQGSVAQEPAQITNGASLGGSSSALVREIRDEGRSAESRGSAGRRTDFADPRQDQPTAARGGGTRGSARTESNGRR